MRKILFRGKRTDTGEWVEGFYSNELYANKHYISKWYYGSYAELQNFEVIPETVGQYTGATDVNGKRIFEGDIVREERNIEHINTVEFSTEDVGSCGCCFDKFYGSGFIARLISFARCEVIGNIFDNPDIQITVK